MERGVTSVQDRIVAPSQDEMRRSIGNGECPFCGRRFKNVAAHTNRTHGVDSNQLKEMAGIPKSHSVCSDEYRVQCSDRQTRALQDDPDRKARLVMSPKPKARTYSSAGRRVQMEKLVKAHEALDPIAAGRKTTLTRREKTRDRDISIVKLYKSGASLSEIMDSLEVTAQVVNGALRFYGVKRPDFRSRRQVPKEHVEALKVKGAEWIERRTRARLKRWDESEQTRAVARQLADEWGQDAKSVVAFLRSHGREIPDGRSDPHRLRKQSAKQERIERFRELGGDFNAVRTLANELSLRVAGLAQYLRDAGEVFDDGRTVARR